jgi:hypothetical protein
MRNCRLLMENGQRLDTVSSRISSSLTPDDESEQHTHASLSGPPRGHNQRTQDDSPSSHLSHVYGISGNGSTDSDT